MKKKDKEDLKVKKLKAELEILKVKKKNLEKKQKSKLSKTSKTIVKAEVKKKTEKKKLKESIYFTGIYYPEAFDFVHIDVRQALFVFMPLVLSVAWLRKACGPSGGVSDVAD